MGVPFWRDDCVVKAEEVERHALKKAARSP